MLAAASADVDLLVLGSRGLHGVKSLGSVSERVGPPGVVLDAHRARELTPVRVGDTVLIATSGHLSTSPDRRGQIVDVLGERGLECYLVRWPDGCVSVLPPVAVTPATSSAVRQRPLPRNAR